MMNRAALCALGALLVAFPVYAQDAEISIHTFANTPHLSFNGAAANAGSLLRLTPIQPNNAGSAFLDCPMTLDGDTSFSTRFQFEILGPENREGGHGIAFIVQGDTRGSDAIGGFGSAQGYAGITPSLVIELDTSLDTGDPDDNHLALHLGGDPESPTTSVSLELPLEGDRITTWIDYDGATDTLTVALSGDTTRPLTPQLSAELDLATELGVSEVYFGFAAATNAAARNVHDIRSWELTVSGQADADADGVIDRCDNCPDDANPAQQDSDSDDTGDACSTDDDGDTVLDEADNCPTLANTDQADTDNNTIGDACEVMEICDNATDDDLDGSADCDDLDCATDAACTSLIELCTNGADDDLDDAVDCADPICLQASLCVGGDLCANHRDDDGDGARDCEDDECVGDSWCVKGEVCTNGLDDDGDGATDCVDAECRRTEDCSPEICDNGLDEDGDGNIDCEDNDCDGVGSCPAEDCENGIDDDGDGDIDCLDPSCAETPLCLGIEVACTDGSDNDGDGDTDCADVDCLLDPACVATTELCNDGIDQDLDGLIDCEDPDCATFELCLPLPEELVAEAPELGDLKGGICSALPTRSPSHPALPLSLLAAGLLVAGRWRRKG